MRVLMLNYEYPPLGGGAGNAAHHLLMELAKHDNVSVDLISSAVGNGENKQLSSNIIIHLLDIGKTSNLHYQTNLDLLTYSFRSFVFSRKLIAAKPYDLVHAFFGIPCGFMAMNLKVPYIVSLRGSDVPFYSKRYAFMDKHLFARLSRSVWRNAKVVVANSHGLRELAKKTSPNQQICVIPNGVDTEFFTPKKNHRTKRDKLRLISTGRLIERKGYEHLIRAMQGLDGVELVLVGDGNLSRNLKDLSKELKVTVEFVGMKPKREVRDLLSDADVFVLPSLNEGMSNSLLEAMACGLPVITTDVPGSDELVKDNGFVVEQGSAKALREAIEHYLKNQNLTVDHGAVSRKLAQKMSWRAVADQYLEIYRSIG